MTRRALFTSPVQPIAGCSPDVYSWNKQTSRIKIVMSFLNHPGLCFLAANVPGLEILEYPSWEEFCAALRDPPEVLGISFYINETELALKMVRQARACGVREIWAGNYGAYSPHLSSYFDRVITGWGEREVCAALGAAVDQPLVHPPMYGCFGTNLLPHLSLNGFLYTSRGCPFTCNYCQTPDFYGKANTVPLEAIDRVLHHYASHGVLSVHVLDENFGVFAKHTQEVIRLFKKHHVRWMPLCRVDLLLKHFDEWREHGLFGAHLGVESLNQASLKGANKRLDQSKSIEVLRLLSRHHMIVQAFYMIGFDEDSPESVRADIELLSELDVDLPQVQIVTPYPLTPLRDEIDKRFGILDDNLSLYNSRNLVWEHPHFRPGELEQVQTWANRRLFSSQRALRTVQKVLMYNCTERLSLQTARELWREGRMRNLSPRLQQGMRGARAWAKAGWYAYEETAAAARLLPQSPALSAGASARQAEAANLRRRLAVVS